MVEKTSNDAVLYLYHDHGDAMTDSKVHALLKRINLFSTVLQAW
jgi:hypothetical protein